MITFPFLPSFLPPRINCLVFLFASFYVEWRQVDVLPFATSLPLKTQASGLPLAKVQRLPTHSNVDGSSWPTRATLGSPFISGQGSPFISLDCRTSVFLTSTSLFSLGKAHSSSGFLKGGKRKWFWNPGYLIIFILPQLIHGFYRILGWRSIFLWNCKGAVPLPSRVLWACKSSHSNSCSL